MKGDPMVRAQGRTKPDRSWYPEDFDWYLNIDADISGNLYRLIVNILIVY